MPAKPPPPPGERTGFETSQVGPRQKWPAQDKRNLLITIAGTLVANLATVVVVFGGLALIKHVEHCTEPNVPPGGSCPTIATVPVWPHVWLITAGSLVAAGLFAAARRVQGRLEPPWIHCRSYMAGSDLTGGMIRTVLALLLWAKPEDREVADDTPERITFYAHAVQWVTGLYIVGVIVMWVGLGSGVRI